MAGIRTENKIYEVGIYCRLSKDDGTDNESASIATQKSILTDYVKRQGWHLAKTYVDDGYSGTNFQRPSFQNMIKDIENGLINCVITKDLSRLGRNYLDCGLYLEVFFPEHNVRYIAVNDGVDTLNKSAMDITPFRNILNEMYSADVSVKIKSAYRARFQQGKFMGTTAPYGYVKDPADHNHLLIDDKVAHVVREIFDLALAGNGIAKIRKHINKQHILRPAAYAVEQGATGYERYFEDNEENRYIWSENSVRGILRSPIYAGNLAGYKRIAANMKSKKRPSKLPEEWEVIPDTHEGIVTQEEFDTVQQLMTSRRREQNAGGFENIFSGVIKCADCGYAMRAASANRRKRPDIIDCVQYTCNNYGRYGNVMCSRGSVIPLWIDQIKAGNPITVTEPSMTRFIMSLEEAVDLVLFAFEKGENGDLLIMKAPACTIQTQAEAVCELFGGKKENIKVIGIRHGEKLYETLLTNEECAKAEDMGDFYRVPADNRSLNYDKFFTEGDNKRCELKEFNSDNTRRLNLTETKVKIAALEYVQNELNGIFNLAK